MSNSDEDKEIFLSISSTEDSSDETKLLTPVSNTSTMSFNQPPYGASTSQQAPLPQQYAPISSSMYLQMLPFFSGSEDNKMSYGDVLRAIETVISLSGLPEETVIIMALSRFKDEAMEFAREISAHDRQTLAAFKEAIKTYYRDTRHLNAQLNSWMNISQMQRETVKEFSIRLKKAARTMDDQGNPDLTYNKLKDSMVKSRFITGLKTPLARVILTLKPTTLEEAISYAVQEEANEAAVSTRNSSTLHAVLPHMSNPEENKEDKMMTHQLLLRIQELEKQIKEPKFAPKAKNFNIRNSKPKVHMINLAAATSIDRPDEEEDEEDEEDEEEMRDEDNVEQLYFVSIPKRDVRRWPNPRFRNNGPSRNQTRGAPKPIMNMQQEPVQNLVKPNTQGTPATNMERTPLPGRIIKCQMCNQVGHIAPNCPKVFRNQYQPAEKKESSEIICYNCREAGHISPNCPLKEPLN